VEQIVRPDADLKQGLAQLSLDGDMIVDPQRAALPAVMLRGTAYWNEELGYLFLNTTLIVILGTTIIATVLTFMTEKSIDRGIRKKKG